MTLLGAFELALFVISASIVAMMLGIVGTKFARAQLEQRTARLTAEVRPIVLSALDERGLAPALTERRRNVAESIAIALLPKLRGADRDALAALLVDTGIIDDAVAGLAARSAARRQRAAELLGNAGHHPAERQLATLLHDRDVDVRITAARALGRIGDARSVADLFAGLGDRRVPANTASMAVLRIGAIGSDGILAATQSGLPRVRSIAAELAGSLGLVSLAPRLEHLLDDTDRSVRTSAARALGRMGVPMSAVAIIVRLDLVLAFALDDRDDDEVTEMIRALGRIGHRSAIPVLESSLMRNHRLSRAAAEALAAMGPRRSVTSQRERDAERGAVDEDAESDADAETDAETEATWMAS